MSAACMQELLPHPTPSRTNLERRRIVLGQNSAFSFPSWQLFRSRCPRLRSGWQPPPGFVDFEFFTDLDLLETVRTGYAAGGTHTPWEFVA